MKKYIIIVISILGNYLSFAQTKSNVLYVIQSGCDQSVDVYRVQDRIVNQTFRNDTFDICIGVKANCAGIFDVQSEYANDTIYFSYNEGAIQRDTIKKRGKKEIVEYASMAGCDCCFEFQFKAFNLPKQPKYVKINGIEFKYYTDKYKKYPIKFDLLNADTINFIDEYGFKQGKWNKIENERNFEIDSSTKYEFEATYIGGRIKTANFIKYDSSGRITLREQRTDFDKGRIVKYYENGKIKFESINNGYRIGSISYSFFENGAIERVYTRTDEFHEEQVYYENGKLKKLSNSIFQQEYYPNEVLKYERIIRRKNTSLWSKCYYDNGKIMSIYYIKDSKKYIGQVKRWRKYYDINGKRVTEEYLIQRGFKPVLDL
jgi:antitoxin component YwqK of YwqJK toxin-antitoxin module